MKLLTSKSLEEIGCFQPEISSNSEQRCLIFCLQLKCNLELFIFTNVRKVEWRVSSLKIFIWTFVYSFYLHCVPSLISQSRENQFLFVWQTNVGCWRATEVKLHQILWWYCFQLFNHHKVEAFQPNLFTLLWIINSKEGVSSTFLLCFLPGSSVFS